MKPFQNVIEHRPGRSKHDIGYRKLLTCDAGQLIPIMCDEVLPFDSWKISMEAVIRMMPLVAPVLHPIYMYVHYFFVPYRLLWPEPNGWETFISGGVSGDETPAIPLMDNIDINHIGPGSLNDYLGFPTHAQPTASCYPLDFPRRAYAMIFNEYYRDESLQQKIDPVFLADILNRNWKKDYFTSALLSQQRGTAGALPISGIIDTFADWAADVIAPIYDAQDGAGAGMQLTGTRVSPSPAIQITNSQTTDMTTAPISARVSRTDLINNTVSVDLSGATTFNVADLRLAFQVQRFMERNARSGARYCEFLRAHFGVSPHDARMMRPEYIGGVKTGVIISEVLQTSQTTTGTGASPQGNMSGHGISVSSEFVGQYQADEFGLIMGIMSIMPEPSYQQGINRQWLRRTKFDFPFPEFMHLSEQAITNAELYLDDGLVDDNNKDVFGFQGRFDELRYKPNMVCGLMRTDFAHWHLGRIFDACPTLNEDFIKCVPDKRIFAVPSQPGFLVHFANKIEALRPIPIMSEPGLIDHN